MRENIEALNRLDDVARAYAEPEAPAKHLSPEARQMVNEVGVERAAGLPDLRTK